MKQILRSLTLCAVLGAVSSLNAQSTITVNPAASWIGYMNVFALPSAGGGYQFGSSWGTPDLVATFAGPVLTLAPNVIGDPNPYWYTPAGGPGSTGNKIMDASMYVETTGVYTGQTLTFTGDVLANTLTGNLDPNGNGWTSVAFIKDFAPDYSSSITLTAPLVNGVFSISLATIADPARHVQYGFETIGPDVWATDVGQYGTVKVTAVTVPEPATLALLAVGSFGLIALRRKSV